MKNKVNKANLKEKFSNLNKEQKLEISDAMKGIKEHIIQPLMEKSSINLNNDNMNIIVNDVFQDYLLPSFLKEKNMDFIKNKSISDGEINDIINKGLKLDNLRYNDINFKTISKLIKTIGFIGNGIGYLDKIGYSDFIKNGIEKSLNGLIDLHGDFGCVENDDFELFRNHINIYRSEELREIINIEGDSLIPFGDKIYDLSNDINRSELYNKSIDKLIELNENYISLGYIYINKEYLYKLLNNDEKLAEFVEDFESNICEDYGITLIGEEGFYYDDYDNDNLGDIITLDIINSIDPSIIEYIIPQNIMKLNEKILNNGFDNKDKYGYRDYSYNIVEKFNKIPDHFKDIISLLISNTIKESPDQLSELIQNSGKKTLDLYDIIQFSFEINGMKESRGTIKKIIYKNTFVNYITALGEKNETISDILNNNIKLMYLLEEGTGKNFILDIDLANSIENVQNDFQLWDDDIYNESIHILTDGYLRKSEYIFDKVSYNKSKYSEEQKEKLNQYLQDNEIYEFEDMVYFEFDGVNEILSMGVGPQASCQNFLIETGHNEHILGNAILNPYTKLVMGFKKPEGFKGIDFEKKAIITEVDGQLKKYPLKVENRMLMVLGDTERSNGILLQNNYGKSISEDNLNNINLNLKKKYEKIGKDLSKQYLLDKADSIEKTNSWIYEEGDGE